MTEAMDRLSPSSQETLRTLLRSDPVWSAYALADLHPPFDQNSLWQVAEEPDAGPGALLIYTEFAPPAFFAMGSAAAVAQALAAADLPEEVYLTVPDALMETVGARYLQSDDRRPMMRMVLPAHREIPLRPDRAVPMKPDHEPLLRELYAHGGPFTPDAFTRRQLEHGFFYGIFDAAGALVAAGGTHVYCRPEKVAAIGNIYTRPDGRGRGYGRQITAAILHDLRRDGIETIVLNVDRRNLVAHDLYAKLGFVDYCPYWEGIARRRTRNQPNGPIAHRPSSIESRRE